MPTIIELQSKLRDTEEIANDDAESAPYAARQGRITRRNNAIAEVQVLKALLQKTAVENAAAVFLTGPKEAVEEFSVIAEDEGEAVTVMANSVYLKLASDIWPAVGVTGYVNVNHVETFAMALQALSETLGVFIRVNPSILGDFIARGKRYSGPAEFAADIKTAVRAAVGTELEVMFIEKTIGDVVAAGYGQNVVPVVVLGAAANDELVEKLFDGGNLVVEVKQGNEANQVKTTFKKLKEVFKNKHK